VYAGDKRETTETTENTERKNGAETEQIFYGGKTNWRFRNHGKHGIHGKGRWAKSKVIFCGGVTPRRKISPKRKAFA
jgi:hypothetical protein